MMQIWKFPLTRQAIRNGTKTDGSAQSRQLIQIQKQTYVATYLAKRQSPETKPAEEQRLVNTTVTKLVGSNTVKALGEGNSTLLQSASLSSSYISALSTLSMMGTSFFSSCPPEHLSGTVANAVRYVTNISMQISCF
jgi:hypothetical protein